MKLNNRRQATSKNRFKLARKLYCLVADSVESLEAPDNMGPDLAYLLGAILTNGYCFWPAERPIVRLLREQLSAKDSVWN